MNAHTSPTTGSLTAFLIGAADLVDHDDLLHAHKTATRLTAALSAALRGEAPDRKLIRGHILKLTTLALRAIAAGDLNEGHRGTP
jgi:hypothetical protein